MTEENFQKTIEIIIYDEEEFADKLSLFNKIKLGQDNWVRLNYQFDEYSNNELRVSNHVTYREIPTKDSLLLIAKECNVAGLIKSRYFNKNNFSW